MAAAAIHPALPSPLPPPRSLHRIPAASARPICPILRFRRLHLSPFVSSTFRQELVPVSLCGIHNFKNRSVGGYAVPARRSRLLSRVGLFEFRGGVCRIRGTIAAGAGAGAGAARGDSAFVEYEWVKKEAVEGANGAKHFLMLVLKNLEARRHRIIQWALWLAVVVGTVTLAGILTSRFAVGRVFPAIVVAASFFGLLVEDEKLHLIGEGFESVYVKAGHQAHILSGAISKAAHDSHELLASCLSSIIPTLAGNLKGDNVKNLSSEESLLISEAGGFSVAPSGSNKDSRTDNPGLVCEPSVETLVRNISESVSQLRNIISTAGLSAARPDSLSGIKSEIQDLFRELQSVEAALLAPKSEFNSKVNQGAVGAPDSQPIPGISPSNPQHEQSSDQPLSTKCILVEEASKAPPFHQSITALSTYVEGIEESSCIGVSTYARVDFWGKNAGSISKTTEQRGALTKSKATARGSSFGSMDDLDNDRIQEQRRRRSLEEDQQQNVRRVSPSSSRAAQPWDGKYQRGAPGREPLRDEQRMYLGADSSPAADDYRRVEADVRGPQVLRVDPDLEETKNTPLVSMERRADEEMPQPRYRTDPRGDLVYPASNGRKGSPPGRTVSTRISDSGPSTSREGEGRWSTQPIDDARIPDEGSYSGSSRVRDILPNPEGIVSRGRESGPGNGKDTPDSSLAYTPTQPEVIESSFALEQSNQAQTVKFQNYLDEAEALLEQGMQGLEGRIEVGVAERMLYEAANLLGKACQIYPADLTVVGQLGNTLLVHGQLKLKLSQQLRTMLPSPKANYPLMKGEAALAGREQQSMELTLQEVCEECEELLVDAGRKFRTALSLDKSDVRALYNWGLALCYRGQLIAEEGGERSRQDADKVYLAAIDKFEAMLGISQDYVSGALLNWGLAMQDRARLRDMGDKERVQLLLQAKELFQDAVRLDPTNGQARGSLAVCSAELKELQGFDALQRETTMEKPKQNWWQRRG